MLRLIVAALLLPTAAAAHQGEWNFDLVVAPEVASTVQPVSPPDTALFGDEATLVIKPRVGLGARYSVTSSFYIGLGLQAAGSTSITTRGVTIDNAAGDVLTASYFEASTPVLLGFRLDTGVPFAAALELELAPLGVYWGDSAFVDPQDLDDQGRPALYKNLENSLLVGGYARANLLFAARFWDVGFDVGPAVTVAWTGTPSVHIGLLLRPSLIWGGPI